MGAINVKKLGLAVGLTFVILRSGCVIVLLTTTREQSVLFFNTLLHGLDVSSILRTGMSALEMTYGIIQIFILGWLTGASIASIYNFHLIKFDNEAKSMNI
ncbi:MAG: DUF5676 family membrane protein [Candidatus Omnitrophota bacterium]|nr:DUF5676 family membrane protein [Candidatus Omnitrophota bacterium]